MDVANINQPNIKKGKGNLEQSANKIRLVAGINLIVISP